MKRELLSTGLILFSIFIFIGCESVNNAASTTGKATGEVFNTVGKITESGAETIKGEEENPYGR